MADSPARRCALVWCGSTDGVRWWLVGNRCRAHTPSAMAGAPEPDELLARHCGRLDEITSGGGSR